MWEFWTTPALLARWWGKRGWVAEPESIVLDLRPGGRFFVRTVHTESGETMETSAVFGEIVPLSLLSLGGAVVEFVELGDGRTEMTFRTSMDASDVLVARARGGLGSAFDRLAAALAR